MKVSEIQQAIFEQTGLKTSFKRMVGSMKHHVKIWPIFQGGQYPKFPFDWAKQFEKQFKPDLVHDCFPHCGVEEFNIPMTNITEFDPITYKKERKAKPVNEDAPAKGWGSKNSQMRLDKAAARYAKALRRGDNRATYY